MSSVDSHDVSKRTKLWPPSVGVLLIVALFLSCGGGLIVFQMSRSGIRGVNALGGGVDVDVRTNPVWDSITDTVEIDKDALATDGDVKKVELSGSQVTDRSIQILCHFGHIRRITIENTPLTDAGLNHLAPVKSATVLKLHDLPNVTDRGLARLAQLPRLNGFLLSEMQITGNRISEFSQLEYLDLTACPNLDDRLFERIGRMKNLVQLTLSRSSKITDAGLAELAALPQLTLLRLGSMPITGRFLSRLTSLEILELSNCANVNDATLKQIGGLTNLRKLRIWDSPVTDAGLEHLAGLTRLDTVHLDGLKITDEGLQFISENFPGLCSLSLRHLSGITDEGVLKLSALKSLERLDIQDSGISPEIEDKLSMALPGCRVRIR